MKYLTRNNLRPLLFVIFCTCGVLTWLTWPSVMASKPDPFCPVYAEGSPADASQSSVTLAGQRTMADKPILLVWWWPLGIRFSSDDCMAHFNIDGCMLTDDRSVYSSADAVLFFHKTVARDLSNLPRQPRPPFQKWIWYNVESPTNTAKKVHMDGMFNLTLSLRRDSDIVFRYELSIVRNQEVFEPPQKTKLVCWITSNTISGTGAMVRLKYYNELRKYVRVTVYGTAVPGAMPLMDKDYYSTIGSCKFYLAFENSIHNDYITEKLNGPMVAGTVPIVLGAPRENYEQFVPADSFIHVNDFPDPEALAKHLLELDQNPDMYLSYFAWRRHFKATPHLLVKRHIQPICIACDHIAKDNSYKVVHDLSWWFNRNVEGHQW